MSSSPPQRLSPIDNIQTTRNPVTDYHSHPPADSPELGREKVDISMGNVILKHGEG